MFIAKANPGKRNILDILNVLQTKREVFIYLNPRIPEPLHRHKTLYKYPYPVMLCFPFVSNYFPQKVNILDVLEQNFCFWEGTKMMWRI